MIRAFPNQLNQQKVIQLANSVVPDLSTTFESNQHGGQFGNQEQFMHNQNTGHVHQQGWSNKNQAMLPPTYTYIPCPCCYWMDYRYY